MKSFLLKHELRRGIKSPIDIFIPKNTLKLPNYYNNILYNVCSVYDNISFIIESTIFLNLS
jgi:hypothetical protein